MYHFYPHVYWQCAVLTVNAAANEEVDDSKSTNYGKVASAVSSMQSQGAKIALPDINQARFGFTPNAEKGEITFGLKAISGCGDDDAAQIIRNRPYVSLADFVEKNSNFTKGTIISLIKAGCFDALEGKDRAAIMRSYLILAAQRENPPKDKLNMQNIKSILSLGLLDSSFDFEKRLIGFRSYVFSAPNMVDKDTYRCDPVAQTFFENSLDSYFSNGVDYAYQGDQLFLYKKPFEKFYKQAIKPVADFISTPEFLKRYNDTAVLSAAADLWDKNCKGTIPQWEMQSLSFYYTRHYLSTINANAYGITSFSSIPQDPVVVGTSTRTFKDKATGESKVVSYDKYQLYRIAGTVLDKNKNKHIITLLTTDGVVSVKFYAEAFAFYDRRITTMEGDKKKVVEESWFSRGSNLLVYGMRRGDMFYPKKYQDSIYQHTVSLITDVFDNGQMSIQNERAQV